MQSDLDVLAWQFSREFSRHEHCLKAVGLRKQNQLNAEANWLDYAKQEQIVALFREPPPGVADAIAYYINEPPKKQINSVEGQLDWEANLPDHKTDSELVLQLICRTRNNLFHGGKFNDHWFEPDRSSALLRNGLLILSACIEAHPNMRKAYVGGVKSA